MMKAIFGILGLVLVLAIVGSIAKKQLQAVGLAGGGPGNVVTRADEASRRAADAAADTVPAGDRDGATLAIPGGMPGAVAADPNIGTVPQQARNIESQVRDNAVRAMQQGMQRNQRAEP
ncbi:MAG TPA: hypothetical protein VFF72_03195 [Caldimonas sp.]|nr:hypothetical protein [Caldimonas sp.]